MDAPVWPPNITKWNWWGLIKCKDTFGRTNPAFRNESEIPFPRWNSNKKAENAGAKLYKWDKRDGYVVPKNRNLYNSYFYPVEDPTYDPLTKMRLQGIDFIGCLDGGSAYHCNLSESLSKEQYKLLMNNAIKMGCSYFTFNIPNTVCNNCGHIDKRYLHECPVCGSKNLDYMTRIIGYLKRISNFSEPRQLEASIRYYADKLHIEPESLKEMVNNA